MSVTNSATLSSKFNQSQTLVALYVRSSDCWPLLAFLKWVHDAPQQQLQVPNATSSLLQSFLRGTVPDRRHRGLGHLLEQLTVMAIESLLLLVS